MYTVCNVLVKNRLSHNDIYKINKGYLALKNLEYLLIFY